MSAPEGSKSLSDANIQIQEKSSFGIKGFFHRICIKMCLEVDVAEDEDDENN